MAKGRCPVCRQKRSICEQTILTGATLVRVPAPMYERGNEGEPGYISPRCYGCYDQAERDSPMHTIRVKRTSEVDWNDPHMVQFWEGPPGASG